MGFHTPKEIKNIEQELTKRYEVLQEAIKGRPMNADELFRSKMPDENRYITPSSVRIAVDDFKTIYSEIKKSLGK